MYKIAICDDDKRYRKTIREIIEHENSLSENEIRFYEYESGNELLKHTDIYKDQFVKNIHVFQKFIS